MSYKSLLSNATQELITINVETLTGKTFQLKVSSQDTVRAIKYKIQRVEGIPMSHQHLLYNSKELEDSATISGPPTAVQDQATLKLVLSMRGGPISLVPQTVPLGRALKDFARLNRESLEKLPPGSKMAVVVLRIGDELNLLHVVEDADEPDENTANDKTHLSEFNSVLEGENSKTVDENSVMMGKVNDLKEKMEKLSIGRKPQKFQTKTVKEDTAKEHFPTKLPELYRSKSSVKLPSIILPVPKKFISSRRQFSQVPILPDLVPQPLMHISRNSKLVTVESEVRSTKLGEMLRPKTCPVFQSGSQFHTEMAVSGRCLSTVPGERPQNRAPTRAEELEIRREFEERLKRRSMLRSLNVLPPISNVSDKTEINKQQVTLNDRAKSDSESRSDEEEINFKELLDKKEKRIKELISSYKYKQNTRRSIHTKRSESAFHFNADHPPESSYRECWSGPARNKDPLQFDKKNNMVSPLDKFTNKTTSDCKSINLITNTTNIIEPELNDRKGSFIKSGRLRCLECKKRLSVCTTFKCKCGFSFCPMHRYYEAHQCTYDFKKESQKALAQANQSVIASKLPKI